MNSSHVFYICAVIIVAAAFLCRLCILFSFYFSLIHSFHSITLRKENLSFPLTFALDSLYIPRHNKEKEKNDIRHTRKYSKTICTKQIVQQHIVQHKNAQCKNSYHNAKKESITLKSFNTLNKETTTKGGPKWEKEWEKWCRKNDIQRTEKTKQSETTRKYFVSAFHNASDKEKQFPKLFFYCWCFHSSVSLMCHGTVCSLYENSHSHSRALSLLI